MIFISFDQFWSLFTTCIDNNKSLSDCSKLSYLISFLKGDAAKILSGMVVRPENYRLAKDLITERYSNSKKLTQSLFDSLLNMGSCGEDLAGINKFYTSVITNIRSLENHGVKIDDYSVMLCPKILSKLPESIRLKCVESFTKDDWKLSELTDYLQKYIKTRESCEFEFSSESSSGINFHNSTFSSLRTNVHSSQFCSSKPMFCVFCRAKDHYSSRCPAYVSYSERSNILRRKSLCFLCLKKGHEKWNCQSGNVCSLCSAKHHVSLCPQNCTNDSRVQRKVFLPERQLNRSSNVPSKGYYNVNSAVPNSIVTKPIERKPIFMQQFSVICENETSKETVRVNVMLDTGSSLTFVRENVCEFLKLPFVDKRKISISTFMNSSNVSDEFSVVPLILRDNHQSVSILATVVPHISPLSPNVCAIDTSYFALPVVNPVIEDTNSEVDILVGLDFYWSVVSGDIKHLPNGTTAMSTVFGWLINGVAGSHHSTTNSVFLVSSKYEEENFEQHIDRVFQHDFSFLGGQADDNELACFLKYIRYDESETRYFTSLPWRKDMKLHNHFDLSVSRLHALYRKLSSSNKLLSNYNDQIEQQLQGGVIETAEPVCESTHYLPHHCVVRDKSSTTNVRIVYDGSAKSSKRDHSLNDCLHKGPKLIPKVLPLLLRFRSSSYGLTADIRKAFLMVGIESADRDYLRFLWFRDINDLSKGLVHYRFCRLPFGLISSPAVLNAVLKHHFESHGKSYHESFYVDDFISGFDSIEKGHEILNDLKSTASIAGFTIHKVISNASELRDNQTESSVLGVPWNLESDTLNVSLVSLQNFLQSLKFEYNTFSFTKRTLLRLLGSIFDPLGIASPITIGLRIVFRNVWKQKLGWDENLPSNLNDSAISHIDNLKSMKLSIQRCVNIFEFKTSVLYGFCDAISCVW